MITFVQDLSFLQRGILAALLVGSICPLIGSFLVVRKNTIISESLSHVTLTGITVGVFIGQTIQWTDINPLYTGLIFALFGSFLIEWLRKEYASFQELAAPVILSAGVGLSALFMSMSRSGYTEWYDYLFGSIVSVTRMDVVFIIFTSIITIIFIVVYYKAFQLVSFDEEFARTSGLNVNRTDKLFSFLVALVIALSMKVVGVLMVGALISLPIGAALILAKSFKQLIWLSILFGELSVISGVWFSYHYDIATGGMIVVTTIVILIMTIAGRKIVNEMLMRQ